MFSESVGHICRGVPLLRRVWSAWPPVFLVRRVPTVITEAIRSATFLFILDSNSLKIEVTRGSKTRHRSYKCSGSSMRCSDVLTATAHFQ